VDEREVIMHDVLTAPTDSGCSKLSPIFPYRLGPLIKKSSAGLQRKRNVRELPRSIARLWSLRAIARIIVAIALIVSQIAVSTVFVPSAIAQIATRSESVDRFAKFIDEACDRFAVPAHWVRAVMQVESSGDAHAISSRGAMGLMQLMPSAWVELSVRYGLGLDPFDPRDNILAGTAYLREMHDRFGSAGFLAAYHAGPTRYEQHLATGQPLRPETIAYIASVTPLLGNEQAERAAFRIKRAVPWREAPLFVERTEAR
jgi:soluble lytic murein transglycosylase-like protein